MSEDLSMCRHEGPLATIGRLRGENMELRAEVQRLRAEIARREQTARDDQAHRDYMNGVVGHGAG